MPLSITISPGEHTLKLNNTDSTRPTLCRSRAAEGWGVSSLKEAQLSSTYEHRPTERSPSGKEGPFELETEEPLDTVASNCPM